MSESQGAPRLAGEVGSGETLGPPGPAQGMNIGNLCKAPPKRRRVAVAHRGCVEAAEELSCRGGGGGGPRGRSRVVPGGPPDSSR